MIHSTSRDERQEISTDEMFSVGCILALFPLPSQQQLKFDRKKEQEKSVLNVMIKSCAVLEGQVYTRSRRYGPCGPVPEGEGQQRILFCLRTEINTVTRSLEYYGIYAT